jgi:hypothetical protein
MAETNTGGLAKIIKSGYLRKDYRGSRLRHDEALNNNLQRRRINKKD